MALFVLMGCNGGGPDELDAVPRAVTAGSTPSDAAGSTSGSSIATVPSSLPTLPVPGFAFDVGSEFAVVKDLRGLAASGGLLFAFSPPDTMLRIDPAQQTVASFELGIGPSVGGAPSWVVADKTVWIIGGAFRNQLLELDTTTMTEVRRVELGDDHSVAAANATDVWLMTTRAVRRFDIASGMLGPPIELDVHPGGVAVAPDESVWVSLPAAAKVARIDPATGRVDTFDVAPGPGWIDTDRTSVWVSHPPIASVSRLDLRTGRTIQVIDLDLSAGAVTSAQTGALQAIEDGVWVTVSFPGSRYRNALALVDPSGAVVGARSIQFDSHTWEAVDGAIWIHRLNGGSIIRSSLDDLDDAPPTDELDLRAIVTTTTSTLTPNGGPSEDERTLVAALHTVLDASVPASDLGIEPQSDARRDLIDLAAAQAELRIEPRTLVIQDETATTVFDVLIEGGTVVLPAVELEWHRADDQTWHLDPESFCLLAAGVGLTGCAP